MKKMFFKIENGYFLNFYMEHYEFTNGFAHERVYHCENGPAIIAPDGSKTWFYNGQRLNCSSQEEFIKLVKLKSFW